MNHASQDTNESILKKLQALRWAGRLLTTVALGIGLLAIAGGILLTWGSTHVMFPQVQLLLQQSSAAATNTVAAVASTHGAATNAVAGNNSTDEILTLNDGTKVDRQVLVTLLQGKIINVTSLALTLLGVGTMLTLLLVIFNRRVTLRQVNASLAQISQQLKELQERGQRPL
jgi:hypothetical protein